VGHSLGGAALAECIDEFPNVKGLVLFNSCLNVNHQFPFDSAKVPHAPCLMLLSELDERLPLLNALEDADYHHVDAIVMDGYKHSSGIQPLKKRYSWDEHYNEEVESMNVAIMIAEFIRSIETGQEDKYYTAHVESAKKRYQPYFDAMSPWNIEKDVDHIQSQVSPNHYKCIHHAYPFRGLLPTLFYLTVDQVHRYLDAAITFPIFICSHPNENNIHSYVPLKDNLVSYVFPRFFIERELWCKLKVEECMFQASQLNEELYHECLASISEHDRAKYFRRGKELKFGTDIRVNTGLGYVFTPLFFDDHGGYVNIRSPVLRVKDRANCKLLSRAQVLEWILYRSFM
jgi:hypothetical protein